MSPKTSNRADRKITARRVAGSILRRLLHPAQLYRAVQLHWHRKAHRHSFDDAQLALYARILPSEFLHLGYFDDPHRRPEKISVADIVAAQIRYAELLLDLAGDPRGPVLDVGCGMGGLCRMLLERGFSPVALTPDRLQAAHVAATLPSVPLLRCKLELLTAADHRKRFGTIFTAESLQYLKLDQSLPVLEAILGDGGKWIACDFFHAAPSEDRSCHEWEPFLQKVAEHGWRVSYQRDITAHVLPTLAYVHMWATRLGVPLMQFAFLRLRRKQPGVHHLLSDLFGLLERAATRNIELIDLARFAVEKKYMILVMERG